MVISALSLSRPPSSFPRLNPHMCACACVCVCECVLTCTECSINNFVLYQKVFLYFLHSFTRLVFAYDNDVMHEYVSVFKSLFFIMQLMVDLLNSLLLLTLVLP